jgi:GAF domain-containing protein
VQAAVPSNEAERLRTLKLYNILDTGADKAFDDLTRLAAAICDAPMASITLVDEHRQWFKARLGLKSQETSRDVSFCAHAILEEDVLVVEDATKDPRLADNPSVTADPAIRFYAGAPLETQGAAIGTLCVIDRTPRTISSQQLDALKVLRDAVMTQLELRRALHDLQLVEHFLPMCAWCRSVKSENGTWKPLDQYLMSAVPVTHGMCPAWEAKSQNGW